MENINQIINQSTGLPIIKMWTTVPKKRQNSFRIHKHTQLELCYCVEGSGLYKCVNDVYEIGPGDVFFFRINEPHCITDIKTEQMTLLNLQLSPQFLWMSASGEKDLPFLKILRVQDGHFPSKLNLTLCFDDINKLKKQLEYIYNEFLEQKLGYSMLIKNKVLSIFIELSRALIYFIKKDNRNEKVSKWKDISKATEYIDENFVDELSLNELAKFANMGKTAFSKHFFLINGLTAWDYILIKRVEKALDLIRKTDNTMLHIANECGFNNTANFNKAFKKVTGLTPKAFRG